MKKYLIILLCVLGLGGGCMIYPTSSITHEGYFLPAKPQLYTDLNDEFNNECQYVSEFIIESAQNQDLKQYLTDRGADCETTGNICYFYFMRGKLLEVSQFNLNKRNYRFIQSFIMDKLIHKASTNAIETDFSVNVFNGCGEKATVGGVKSGLDSNSEKRIKQKVKDIINANQ